MSLCFPRDHPYWLATLYEVVKTDMACRIVHGVFPRLEDYLQKFPELLWLIVHRITSPDFRRIRRSGSAWDSSPHSRIKKAISLGTVFRSRTPDPGRGKQRCENESEPIQDACPRHEHEQAGSRLHCRRPFQASQLAGRRRSSAKFGSANTCEMTSKKPSRLSFAPINPTKPDPNSML